MSKYLELVEKTNLDEGVASNLATAGAVSFLLVKINSLNKQIQSEKDIGKKLDLISKKQDIAIASGLLSDFWNSSKIKSKLKNLSKI
jgi:hypothetical protein